MWLDKLNEMKKTTGTRTKFLAEQMHRSERTISRMLSGEASIDMNELQTMVSLMGGALEDIFDGSDFKLPNSETNSLRKEIEAMTKKIEELEAVIALLKAENDVLLAKNNALTAESDVLRLTLSHKDEIIALHNFYNKLIK